MLFILIAGRRMSILSDNGQGNLKDLLRIIPSCIQLSQEDPLGKKSIFGRFQDF